MCDLQVFSDKFMLCADVVVKRDLGKWPWAWLVRRRGGLAISKQRCDDDEESFRVEKLVFSDQPEVVRNC